MIHFIDTNIFLRVLVKEDTKSFDDCFAVLKLIRENEIKAVTSSLVIAEVSWVLGSFYKFSKLEVVEALGGILNLKSLRIVDKTDTAQALDFFISAEVKFIDAMIASNYLIQNKKAVVVSYDKDFDKLNIPRKEPRDVVA